MNVLVLRQITCIVATLPVVCIASDDYEIVARRLINEYHRESAGTSGFDFPPTPIERKQIFLKLGDIGPEARVVIPDILRCLLIEDERREWLTLALDGMADEAVPHLVSGLNRPDIRVRIEILRLLGDLGSRASPATSTVIGLLDDDNSDVKREALSCLREIDASADVVVPALLRALEDEDIATDAFHYLRWLGPRAEAAMGVLLQKLDGPHKRDCLFAIVEIDAIGTDSLPLLIQLLNCDDLVSAGAYTHTLSLDVAKLLAEMGDRSAPAVPAILAMLRTGDISLQEGPLCPVLDVLSANPDESQRAIPILVRLFEASTDTTASEDSVAELLLGATIPMFNKIHIAACLLSLSCDSTSEFDFLLKVLRGEITSSDDLRATAAIAFGQVGPRANRAAPYLRRVIAETRGNMNEGRTAQLFEVSSYALAQIDPKDVVCVEGLRQGLSAHGSLWHGSRYAKSLPRPNVEDLSRLLGDRVEHVKDTMLDCIFSDGMLRVGQSKTRYVYVDVLSQAGYSRDIITRSIIDIRQRSRLDEPIGDSVLIHMGERATDAVPELLNVLRSDGSHHAQARAATVLSHIGTPHREIVDALVGALTHDRAIVRASAARGLGKLLLHSGEEVAAIRSVTTDNYLTVRNAGKSSLAEILERRDDRQSSR